MCIRDSPKTSLFFGTAYGFTATVPGIDDASEAALNRDVPKGYTTLQTYEKRAVVAPDGVLRIWPRAYDSPAQDFRLIVPAAGNQRYLDLGATPGIRFAVLDAVNLAARVGLVEQPPEPGTITARREHLRDAPQTHLSADRLVLLVAARPEHLVEALLVDAAAVGRPVVALDHQAGDAVEVAQPHRAVGQAQQARDPRAVLLVEDQRRMLGRRQLDDVRRRVPVVDLVPRTVEPRDDHLLLHAHKGGLPGDRCVAKRLRLDAAQ